LTPQWGKPKLVCMARYFALVGKRVEVQYRAGDIYLPATAVLVADSGKSIFLEERFSQNGVVKAFRWEIPYVSIMRIVVSEVPTVQSPEKKTEQRAAEEQLFDLNGLSHRPEES
jgi:hypothetical protein